MNPAASLLAAAIDHLPDPLAETLLPIAGGVASWCYAATGWAPPLLTKENHAVEPASSRRPDRPDLAVVVLGGRRLLVAGDRAVERVLRWGVAWVPHGWAA